MMAQPSIRVRGQSCEALFEQLCDAWEMTTIPDCEISLTAITKESERFKTWSKNIAALQDVSLRSSLEYRLRNNQRTRERVEEVLVYLRESLELGQSIKV